MEKLYEVHELHEYEKLCFSEWVVDVEGGVYKSKDSDKLYKRAGAEVTYSDDFEVFTDIEEAVSYTGDKLPLFEGSVEFCETQITDLGQLYAITGTAGFQNSKLTDLGNLQHVAGSVDMYGCKITNLGKLKRVGKWLHFKNEQITERGQLQSVGGIISPPLRDEPMPTPAEGWWWEGMEQPLVDD